MVSWQTPLCPFPIEFAPDKLDEIRIAVVDGFYAVPRGGVEVGGVLYGKREDGRLRILDYRKIETEYLTGPSFRLSEKDLEGLRALLQETRFEDAEVRPVGWFHSHTRSGIHLSEKDLELHQKFFPEEWQVALVLKPDTLGNVKAGYFFRGTDGIFQTETAAEEFQVSSYPKANEAAEVSDPEPNAMVEEAALFRAFQPKQKQAVVSLKKRVALIVLALASLGAGLAGYWVAVR